MQNLDLITGVGARFADGIKKRRARGKKGAWFVRFFTDLTKDFCPRMLPVKGNAIIDLLEQSQLCVDRRTLTRLVRYRIASGD